MKVRFLLLACTVLLAALLSTAVTFAADVTVGTGTPGSCTESAFNTAFATVQTSNGTLIFNCGAAPHTITFTSRKMVNESITIDGGGLITLSGGGNTTVFEINDDVPLLTLKNLTIANGKATAPTAAGVCGGNACGGGVRGHYRASLTVINCTFTNNLAVASAIVKLKSLDYGGGAIYMHTGTLTVENSTFTNNQVTNGSGGAIHLLHSNAFISDTTFDGNHTNYYGGAIYTDGTINDGNGITDDGLLNFTRVTFSNNYSQGQGGAVFNYMYINRQTNILAKYQDVRFIDNTINPDLVGDAYGGALRIGNGPAQIYNSYFSGNTAQLSGGAIWTAEAATVGVWNSTFFGNEAVDDFEGFGGAIHVSSSGLFSITNATFANNQAGEFGGAIWSKGSNVSLVNDIFEDNRASNLWDTSQTCDMTYSNVRNSIQWPPLMPGDKKCGASIRIVDPVLAGPFLEEGFTETMALGDNSAAIDAADSAYCLETDQRGRYRTFDGNWDGKGGCDFSVPSALNAPPYRNVFTTAGATLTWNRVLWATNYEIQVDNNPDFSSVNQDIVVDGSTFSTTTGSDQEGVYYWRVRAQDGSGHWGGWSTPDTFLMTP